VLWLLVTASVSSSSIFVTLMMEMIGSSQTSVLTRAMGHNIPEDGILLIILVYILFFCTEYSHCHTFFCIKYCWCHTVTSAFEDSHLIEEGEIVFQKIPVWIK
jgi:hypothetical protein